MRLSAPKKRFLFLKHPIYGQYKQKSSYLRVLYAPTVSLGAADVIVDNAEPHKDTQMRTPGSPYHLLSLSNPWSQTKEEATLADTHHLTRPTCPPEDGGPSIDERRLRSLQWLSCEGKEGLFCQRPLNTHQGT